MPEIEAAEPGVNCQFFRAGDVDALAHALVVMQGNAAWWRSQAPAIAERCRDRYSVDTLAERLLDSCRPPAMRTLVAR
jgi:hypothetical protein